MKVKCLIDDDVKLILESKDYFKVFRIESEKDFIGYDYPGIYHVVLCLYDLNDFYMKDDRMKMSLFRSDNLVFLEGVISTLRALYL